MSVSLPFPVDTPKELFAAINSAAITPSDTLPLLAVKAFGMDDNGIIVEAAATGAAGNSVTLSTVAPTDTSDVTVDSSTSDIVVTLAATGVRAGLDIQGFRLDAVDTGAAFNGVGIEVINPGTALATASVSVVGNDITLNLGTDAGSKATLTNQGITYNAVTPGTDGNSITIALVNPGTPSASLSVGVVSSAISVNLATDAGISQVETATVLGTIGASGAGNATVVVTSAGMTGSPITLSVAVANSDTATLVAGKIRTAMAANATIAARFTIGGTGAAITLTKIVATANDSTLNISVANGTCTGLTTAATSANTTAGVAPAITTTRQQVALAVNASLTARALVFAVDPGTSTVVTALAATALATGGGSPAPNTTRAQARALLRANSDVTALVKVSGSDENLLRNLVAQAMTRLSGGGAVITSTVEDVVNALNADAGFQALAFARSADIASGSNVCQPFAVTTLSGGTDGSWSLDSNFTRALSVNVSGIVAYVPFNGSAVVNVQLEAGSLYPIATTKVMATDTTATGIVGHI